MGQMLTLEELVNILKFSFTHVFAENAIFCTNLWILICGSSGADICRKLGNTQTIPYIEEEFKSIHIQKCTISLLLSLLQLTETMPIYLQSHTSSSTEFLQKGRLQSIDKLSFSQI